jgi:hypothetical protein
MTDSRPDKEPEQPEDPAVAAEKELLKALVGSATTREQIANFSRYDALVGSTDEDGIKDTASHDYLQSLGENEPNRVWDEVSIWNMIGETSSFFTGEEKLPTSSLMMHDMIAIVEHTVRLALRGEIPRLANNEEIMEAIRSGKIPSHILRSFMAVYKTENRIKKWTPGHLDKVRQTIYDALHND